jgi:hypothetical protein
MYARHTTTLFSAVSGTSSRRIPKAVAAPCGQRCGDGYDGALSPLSTYLCRPCARSLSSSEGMVGFAARSWKYSMSGL